ncbi:unnamed protein product, partial [marine sediment metagenome]
MAISNPTAIDVGYGRCSVELFQFKPASGTWAAPEAMNNGNIAAPGTANAVDQYSETIFPCATEIGEWRHYGHAQNNLDGFWKIQYLSIKGIW